MVFPVGQDRELSTQFYLQGSNYKINTFPLTSTAETAGHVNKLHEFAADLLLRFLQDIHKVLRLFSVRLREESVSGTVPIRTSCPTNTMDVVLAGRRIVDVDDKLYIAHI